MVTNVTSFSRSGLSDFVLQRVSAVVLAVYTLCVVGWFLMNGNATHSDVVRYFGNPFMQGFSTLALLSTLAHAWIGMWTIGTDYIRPFSFGTSATLWRLVYQGICMAVLFGYAVWGFAIIWRI